MHPGCGARSFDSFVGGVILANTLCIGAETHLSFKDPAESPAGGPRTEAP